MDLQDVSLHASTITSVHWGRIGTLVAAAVCLLLTGVLIGGGGTVAYEEQVMQQKIEEALSKERAEERAREAKDAEILTETKAELETVLRATDAEVYDLNTRGSVRAEPVISDGASASSRKGMPSADSLLRPDGLETAWTATGPLALVISLDKPCPVRELVVKWDIAGLPEQYSVEIPSPVDEGGGWAILERVEQGDSTFTDLSVPGHAVQTLQLADNDSGETRVRSIRIVVPGNRPISLWGILLFGGQCGTDGQEAAGADDDQDEENAQLI